MVRQMTPKAAKAKCDSLFSAIVRSTGYCERCGRRPPEVRLETSHWISRRFSSTRCEPDNAFCMCSACHRWWHNYPTDASDWAISIRGRDVYERLRDASQKTSKVDWPDQVRVLREMLRGVA